jgi:TonB family protein
MKDKLKLAKAFLLTLLFSIPSICISQVVKTRYFKDPALTKEVPEDMARYAWIETTNGDSSITISVKDLKKNVFVDNLAQKVAEPYGKRIGQVGNRIESIDYDFRLVYSSDSCKDRILPAGTDVFKDHPASKYTAPVIASGEKDFLHFFGARIRYPSFAMKKNISGDVQVQFTIHADGSVGKIVVTKGLHVVIDKEAVRVIRQLKFLSPPMVDGKPIELCVSMPLKFRLA